MQKQLPTLKDFNSKGEVYSIQANDLPEYIQTVKKAGKDYALSIYANPIFLNGKPMKISSENANRINQLDGLKEWVKDHKKPLAIGGTLTVLGLGVGAYFLFKPKKN